MFLTRQRIFFVSLGAIPASLFRWLIPNDLFVNIIGTLVLGFIAGFGLRNRYKLTIAIGFCASCTTFSSWIVNIIEFSGGIKEWFGKKVKKEKKKRKSTKRKSLKTPKRKSRKKKKQAIKIDDKKETRMNELMNIARAP